MAVVFYVLAAILGMALIVVGCVLACVLAVAILYGLFLLLPRRVREWALDLVGG